MGFLGGGGLEVGGGGQAQGQMGGGLGIGGLGGTGEKAGGEAQTEEGPLGPVLKTTHLLVSGYAEFPSPGFKLTFCPPILSCAEAIGSRIH